jgi:formylglycine-generating enzyme required for sulfatase activity
MPGKLLIGTQPFEPNMILIPAGEFQMGSDRQKDPDTQSNEEPRHTLYLPAYYLAQTPVTNGQYRAFVAATGHKPEVSWKVAWLLPRDRLTNEEDHPARVEWSDALAFCRWLSKVTGKTYTLPSEAEWEKAARGTDGRIYPWGNQWDKTRCNSAEGGLNKTTSVRAYPHGASPYGVLDMAGNVREWTRSLWSGFSYPYNPQDGREALDALAIGGRMLRGGSYIDGHQRMRCADRSGFFDMRLLVGFRVMMRPAS